jgi:tetratricopeptide (TPR) repeat protein
LQLTPDNTDAYIIKGLALVQLKRKNEAMECFNKAKELGDDRAEGYIKKYK